MQFVMVHGAWHGGWCWDHLEQPLAAHGARMAAPDLPGHGQDTTPHSDVTLDAYAERIANVVIELDTRVHLVGHSMGGAVISQVAERISERIASLTYLCAFLLRDGESISSRIAESQHQTEDLNRVVRAGDEPGTSVIDPDQGPQVFYHDCPEQDVQRALSLLVPQAAAPITAPVTLSESRYGSIPRAYILCTEDRAIAPAMQRELIERSPCDAVIEMHTAHSPFFAQPQALADHLVGFATAHS